MHQKYTVKLNISLADGGKSAEEVIELYGARVAGDIEQTAWNLCECDDQEQSEKFSNLVLENWDVSHKHGDDFHVSAQFTVNAQNIDFVNQVIEDYMDGFEDWIAATANGYYSRTGKRVSFNSQSLSWESDIK